MDMIVAGILGYVILQLAIGLLVSRRIRTEEDYLLAGRRLGYPLATFSIFATWFGAESCIGVAGAAYENGLAGVTSDPFGYTICLLLMGLVLAGPLWKLKMTTIADLFRLRYSGSVEKLAAAIMIPTSLLWAAAQIHAFGIVLSASSDFTVTFSITMAAVVVIVYTVMGGLLADATTDIIQGFAVILGLVILLPMVVSSEHVDVGHAILERSAGKGSAVGWLHLAESLAIPVCGSLVAQELVSRVIASRSPKVARQSSLLAAAMYLSFGLIPVVVGLAGSSMEPGLANPEHILPTLARKYFSTFTYVLFAGAIVSAILSTVDSALLAASALFSHNILLSIRASTDERLKVRYGRIGVVIMGILAYVLALHAEGVYKLVKDASSFGSAGILIVVLFGLFSKFGDHRSALATLATGTAVWTIASYGFEFQFSYLLALVTSCFVYILVGLFEGRFRNRKKAAW